MRNPLSVFVGVLSLTSASASAQSEPVIDLVAGGGPRDVPALTAALGFPFGVAFDAVGNFYIACASGMHTVFKVDPSGQLTIAAGLGNFNFFFQFAGDNGPATEAALFTPLDVVVDLPSGDLYIADSSFNAIRRVDATSGIITTVAGIGTIFSPGFSGDGGPATQARLNRPGGIARDPAGNLYIADTGNQRIRFVEAATGCISTIAGNGVRTGSMDGEGGTSADDLGDNGSALDATFNSPIAVAVDGDGNLFISDQNNRRVRRVEAGSGFITTYAGNGLGTTFVFLGDGVPANITSVSDPRGITLDSAGNLYIADFGWRRVRVVEAATEIISTVAGNGTAGSGGDGGLATDAELIPLDVAIDAAGNLLIAQGFPSLVRFVDASTQIITTVAGNGERTFSGDGFPATKAKLFTPRDVAVDAAGNVYIDCEANQRIRKVDAASGIITTVAGGGTAIPGDNGPATSARITPRTMDFDPDGNIVFGDLVNNSIRRLDVASGVISTVAGDGTVGFKGDGRPAINAGFERIFDVAVDSLGNIYICDELRIRRVDQAGIIDTVVGTGIQTGSIDGEGGVDPSDDLGDGGPAAVATLTQARSVTVDGNDNLILLDRNNRIRRVDAVTGIITTVAGDGVSGIGGDGGPAINARVSAFFVEADDDGNIFTSGVFHRCRRIDAATGIIDRVAGTGIFGVSGDGGPALQARLANPGGLAIDGPGNLYIADGHFGRIRKVTFVFDPVDLIEGVRDDLIVIINADPNTPLADKLEDALADVETALVELTKDPPDNQAALGEFQQAVGSICDAVNDAGLDSVQGNQLMDELAGIARGLAVQAIDDAIAAGGDPTEIETAQSSLAAGDLCRDLANLVDCAAFEDAVNEYKDALATAEGAVG